MKFAPNNRIVMLCKFLTPTPSATVVAVIDNVRYRIKWDDVAVTSEFSEEMSALIDMLCVLEGSPEDMWYQL